MNTERRKFLQQLGLVCTGGIARTLGIGCTTAIAATATSSVSASSAGATAAGAVGLYGGNVRAQVFEVIVRQGMTGAPWKEICKGPMDVNHIEEWQIEEEIARRNKLSHTDSHSCQCRKCEMEKQVRGRAQYAVGREIQHSEKSPCACKRCLLAIKQILAESAAKSELSG